MIDFTAIRRFREYKGLISVLSGTNQILGNKVYTYPEYKGDKKDMFDFYDKWAEDNNISSSVLNDTLYTILYSVNYLN